LFILLEGSFFEFTLEIKSFVLQNISLFWVDLVPSTYVTSLMLEASYQFKGLTATISALGRWYLGARARTPDYRQQRQADSGMGAAHR
jgi:hypothetical protein